MSWRHEKVPGQRPLESDQSLHLTAPELKTPPPRNCWVAQGERGEGTWRRPRSGGHPADPFQGRCLQGVPSRTGVPNSAF